jgi:hypothetical protein
MNYKVLKFIPALVLLIALAHYISCTPLSCTEKTESLVNATFYKNRTDSIKPVDSLTVYGIGRDTSKIYNKSLNVKNVQIPLDASVGTCGFVFQLNDIIDTLTLTYTSYPHLISKECGYTYYHILDSYTVTGNTVDTIIFMNSRITTINEENIRIFY